MTDKEKQIKELLEKATPCYGMMPGTVIIEAEAYNKALDLLDEPCPTCFIVKCSECRSKETAEKQEMDVKSIKYRARLKKNNVAEVKQVTPDEIIDLCDRLKNMIYERDRWFEEAERLTAKLAEANKQIEKDKKFSI